MDENLEGYKAYEAEGITVYWKADLCQHAKRCWRSSLETFNPKRRPWVVPDALPAGEVAAIVDNCPSGALKYKLK